ncbi:hypothetical protein AMECASPLE_007623 [Ameca splendens]|uniref:Uncharacterized protein n=1 Tax=Ameca splendens TaxID=208324 RepID=A0ABV0YMW8_9TELE
MRSWWESLLKTGSYAARLQRTSWTRPLRTTAAAPEDRPGDRCTGRLLTGDRFPGDNLLPENRGRGRGGGERPPR